MNDTIPKFRKFMFYGGTALMIIGVVLFMLPFFFFFLEDLFFIAFMAAPVGMVCLIIGGILRSAGSRGLAGSGFILNPKRAREELKPHSEALGGVIDDVLSNTNINSSKTPVIKVRCTQCEALNDEVSKFCNQCGSKL